MTITLEPPPIETPDSGVIKEARARQRRQRGAAAAIVAIAAIAAFVLAFTGGGGGSRPGRASLPRRHPSSQAARHVFT
ncbi:MAG: hypothetical protein ACRDK2_14475, partial [Solirubrobacteraceae bacterium]